MSFITQSAVFPSYDLCSDEDLYFRLNERCLLQYGEVSRVVMHKGGVLSTDTYFNSVSVGKWKSLTGLTDLTLQLRFKGAVALKWSWHRTHNRQIVIGEAKLSSVDINQPVQIPVPQYERLSDGVISFELFALEDTEVAGFEYTTTMAPRRDVKLGITITHFNRQQYVIPAVRRLNQQLLANPRYADRVKLFVVDNSQNLAVEQMSGAQIIPNANLGGSGGFMRGLIHIQDSGEFTHGLFMDDDASTEIEAIRRTIAILQYAKDEKTAVSGAMLFEHKPFIQYENAAWFNGVCHPRNTDLDLRDIGNVVENEKEVAVDYGGWWFFAFPLQTVEKYVFPFFVRGDDSFFCLTNSFSILTLNGIASWQDSFATKDSPYTVYLDTRYHLIHNLLGLFAGASRGKALRLMRSWFKRYTLSYHYESAQTMLDAVEDVVKGPEFWQKNVDMIARRSQIMARVQKEKMQDLSSDWENTFRLIESVRKRGLVSRGTLNGHLLPLSIFKNHNVALKKQFGGSVSDSFLIRKVLYVESRSQKGYVVEYNRKLFFKILLRYYCVCYRFWRDYYKLKKDYQSNLNGLISREFWLKQFETHNK